MRPLLRWRGPCFGPAIGAFVAAVVLGGYWGSSHGHATELEGTTSPPVVNQIYADLQPHDVARASEAVQKALEHQPSGGELRWRNEQTGTGGLVRPLRTFKAAEGYYCRVFVEAIVTTRQERSAERLACRDKSGRWRDAALSKAPPA